MFYCPSFNRRARRVAMAHRDGAHQTLRIAPIRSGNLQMQRVVLGIPAITGHQVAWRSEMTDRTNAQRKMNARVKVDNQEIDVGFIRLYILYSAAAEPVSSSGISEMLRRRGLTLSIRSVSRILRGLESKGHLEAPEVS